MTIRSKAARLTRTLATASARTAAIAAVMFLGLRCGGDKPAPTTSRVSELKAQALLTNNSAQFLVGNECDNSSNVETASAVIPPGANPSCPSGRAFVSFGGWLQQVDLNRLSSPAGDATQTSIYALINAQQPQLPTTPCGASCCPTTTAPLFTTGNDTSIIRTANGGLMLFGTAVKRMTRNASTTVCGSPPASQAPCSPEWSNAVNFVLQSADCGQSWTKKIVFDNGDGHGNPKYPNGAPCGNVVFPRLYLDPYKTINGTNPIYLFGKLGVSCCGGANYSVIYRWDPSVQDFVEASKLRDSLGTPTLVDIMGLTSFPDGTVAAFGCDSGVPRIYWSNGPDDSTFSRWAEGTSMGLCQTQDPFLGNITQGGIYGSSMSRVHDDTISGDYNYFRYVFQTVESWPQNTFTVGYGVIPRAGSTAHPHLVKTGSIPRLSSNSDIFHASFIDPDDPDQPSATTPNTSVLFWEEIDASSRHNARYAAVTGLSNYTLPGFLNLNGTANNPWTRPIPIAQSQVWGGQYDRGSYYHDSSSTATTSVLNYFADWTQGHSQCFQPLGNGFVHYNQVQVTEPRFSEARVSTAMVLGTDPGAARMVTSGGVTQIHVFATDTSNLIKRLVYSDDSRTWTSSWTAVPPWGNAVTNRAPAAVSWGPGRLDVVAIGIDDKQMYHYPEQNGQPLLGGGGWQPLGMPSGGFTEAPAIASQGPNKLFIVGTGTGGALYFQTWTNGWSSWASLGGGVAIGAPAAFSLYPGRVDVMVHGTDNNLWQYVAVDDGSAGWEGRGTWYNLGAFGLGSIAASPSVAVRDTSRIDVFAGDGFHPYVSGALDSNGHQQIMHAWYSSGWSSWHTVGAMLPSDFGNSFHYVVAGVAIDPNRVRVLHRGLDGQLWWMLNGS
jgi:hypothetical protein